MKHTTCASQVLIYCYNLKNIWFKWQSYKIFVENLNFCESLVTVDGYFEDWNEWSSCLQTCGSGYRTRSRACIPPKNGGAPCSQNNRETQQCVLKHCPGMCSSYFTLYINVKHFKMIYVDSYYWKLRKPVGAT